MTTSSTTPSASYTLTVTGTGGGLIRSTTVTLVVGTPSFTLSASPSSRTVRQGRSTSYTITVVPSGGFSGPVALSLTSGLPSGASYSFNPSSTATSSTLSVTTLRTTPAGTYHLAVKGMSGGLTSTTTVSMTVTRY